MLLLQATVLVLFFFVCVCVAVYAMLVDPDQVVDEQLLFL